MSLLLINLKSLLDSKVIDKDQMLFLVYADIQTVFPITAPKLKDLVTRGYIKSGAVGKGLYKEMEKVTVKGTIAPIYVNGVSKEVVQHLCRLLCVKKNGKLHIPGKDDDPLSTTAKVYLKDEYGLAYHYLIMLFLFPGDGDINKRWEKHFLGVKYEGLPLRIRSKSTGRDFVKLAKTKDMGALLLGTYRYIKSCTKGDKAYVTTIPKYLKMHDDWYDQALEDIEGAENVNELFTITGEDTGLMNVVL